MRFEFGDFIVDDEARRLECGGAEVRLSPKGLDLLITLIRERPSVVSRARLFEQLWPRTYVSDASLATVVAEVRTALGESARKPRFVRTVHRHGYAYQGDGQEVLPPARGATVLRAASGDVPGFWLVTSSTQIPLVAGDNLVGRDPALRVWLDSPSVSRQHACIRIEHDHATLMDLGSKNGTHLGDTQVTAPVGLDDGDRLRFGSVDVTFRAWTADATRTEGDA